MRLSVHFSGEQCFVFVLDFAVDGHGRFGPLGGGYNGELHLRIGIPCNKQARNVGPLAAGHGGRLVIVLEIATQAIEQPAARMLLSIEEQSISWQSATRGEN